MFESLTKTAETRLSELFTLPSPEHTYDEWAEHTVVNDALSLMALLDTYEHSKLSDAEKEAMLFIITHSLNRLLSRDPSAHNLWPRVAQIMRKDVLLVTEIVNYWRNLEVSRDARPALSPYASADFQDVPISIRKIKQLQPFGSCAATEISTLEQTMKLRLPLDYKTFLVQHNGGHFKEAYLWLQPHDDSVELEILFGLGVSSENSVAGMSTTLRDELPDGCVAIGRDEYDNYIVLCCDPADESVLYYDRTGQWPSAEGSSRFLRLADSFSEFAGTIG